MGASRNSGVICPVQVRLAKLLKICVFIISNSKYDSARSVNSLAPPARAGVRRSGLISLGLLRRERILLANSPKFGIAGPYNNKLTCFIRYGKLSPQFNSPNTATLIQRGGGTGPVKPRQPSFVYLKPLG